MGIFLADTEGFEQAARATRHGMVASLVFAAMLTLGLILIATTRTIPGEPVLLDGTGQRIAMAIIVVEVAVALCAAWRFWLKKGLIVGSVALLLFVIETIFKLQGGFLGVMWYVIYLGILLGFVNGLRGAWQLNSMPDALPSDVAQAFE